jgi:hypothetical protein
LQLFSFYYVLLTSHPSPFFLELGYALLSFALVWWLLSPPTHDLLPTPFNIPGAIALALCLGSLVSFLDTDHFGVGIPLILVIVFAIALYWMETHAEASLVPWKRLGDKSMLYVLGLAPITAVTDMSVRTMCIDTAVMPLLPLTRRYSFRY